MNTKKIRIKNKSDTSVNWTTNDPILYSGEIGYDITNNEIRVGNGTSSWNNLTPISQVVDNLLSTDSDKALSANQGRILNEIKQNQFAKRMFNNTTGKNYLNEEDIKEGYYGKTSDIYKVFYNDSTVRCFNIELEPGTYTISSTSDNATTRFGWYAIDGVVTILNYVPYFTVTLTETSRIYVTWVTSNHTYVNMKTMIELGSVVTDYEPYIPVPGSSNMDFSFITPEQFGAAGDNATNDLEALNKCIQYAKENTVPVYGYGKYFIGSGTLNLDISNLRVYINYIRSTTTNSCVVLTGSSNYLMIDTILCPNGIGFTITTNETTTSSNSNYLFLKRISCSSYCFYKYSHDNTIRITYNNFNFTLLGSENGDCIRDYGGGGQNLFNGNNAYCYALNGHAIYNYNNDASTYINFCFEQDVKCGVYGEDMRACIFDNIRSTELANEIRTSNDRYVIKLKGMSYGNEFRSPVQYIGVKNEVNAFDAEKAQVEYQNTYFSNCLKFNGTNILKLDLGENYFYYSNGDTTDSIWKIWPGKGNIVTYYNYTGISLDHEVPHDITVTAYTPYTTDAYVPTIFNINENTTITLNDMYFPLGVSEITINQQNDKKAIVKDRHSNTIFNGTSKPNGIYKFKCVVKQNDTTTDFFVNCFCFTGENDIWVANDDTENKIGQKITDGGEIFNSNANDAQGPFSHAEGYNTSAAGQASHAEGINTQATGKASHAEGNWTIAQTSGAHSEGQYTQATGASAHVEGHSSKATGAYSHAEGYVTQANARCSHSEGSGSHAQGVMSHAEGNTTYSIGENSHAEGLNTVTGIMGFKITAISTDGKTFTVKNVTSLAVNDSLSYIDINQENLEFDWGKIASIDTTNNTFTVTEDSTIPSIDTSDYVFVKEKPEIGESFLTGVGVSAHAEGEETRAIGAKSHAEGYQTKAYGDYGHAEGIESIAYQMGSHAEGNSTIASGAWSHAEGKETQAVAMTTHAEGYSSQANGHYSHAEGYNTRANGMKSHAEGHYTQANGLCAHTEGESTIANGSHAHAEGLGTIASGVEQHVEGRYNIGDTENKYLHIVGNGANTTSRSNAYTLDWNGNGTFAGNVYPVGGNYPLMRNLTVEFDETIASSTTKTVTTSYNFSPSKCLIFIISEGGIPVTIKLLSTSTVNSETIYIYSSGSTFKIQFYSDGRVTAQNLKSSSQTLKIGFLIVDKCNIVE